MLVSAAVLAAFALWELCTTFVAYTSDAYVRSDLISVAPQVTGRIISVPIQDNQTVHRGDLLWQSTPSRFNWRSTPRRRRCGRQPRKPPPTRTRSMCLMRSGRSRTPR